MRKHYTQTILILTLASVPLFSCQSNPILPGNDLFPQPEPVIYDTLQLIAWNDTPVHLSNTRSGIQAFGYVKSQLTGTITAATAIELAPESEINIPTSATAKTCWLNLTISRVIVSDTIQLIPASIYRLTARIPQNATSTYIPQGTPLLQDTLSINENSVRVSLPIWLCQSYLDLLIAGFNTPEKWLDAEPGFFIMPDTTSAPLWQDSIQIWYFITEGFSTGIFIEYDTAANQPKHDTLFISSAAPGTRSSTTLFTLAEGIIHAKHNLADTLNGDNILYLAGWDIGSIKLKLNNLSCSYLKNNIHRLITAYIELIAPEENTLLQSTLPSNFDLYVQEQTNTVPPEEYILENFTITETEKAGGYLTSRIHVPWTLRHYLGKQGYCPSFIIQPYGSANQISLIYTGSSNLRLIVGITPD